MIDQVLITSLSNKIPLIKAVRAAVKKAGGEGRIIGADSDPASIGKYFVDQFWEMPPLSTMTIDQLISKCHAARINSIIPTRDGELDFFAKNKKLLEEKHIGVMVSDPEAVANCLDKILFHQKLNQLGYEGIQTASSISDLEGKTFVVKERFGAGGREVGLNLTKEESCVHAQSMKSAIFQPFLVGDEISVDLYIDKFKKVKGVLPRWRQRIVHGESQVTTTFFDAELMETCSKLAVELNLYGHVMFQLIRREYDGKDYFLECNPRFGGASTLSLAMGLDSFYWFFLEQIGQALPTFHYPSHEKTLIRYPEDFIFP